MRAVLQRVAYARVSVDGETVGSIENGVAVLVGMNTADDAKTFDWMFNKIKNMRIFEDGEGKMNLSVSDKGCGILLIPNFTIYADARKGNRPSFAMGAGPDEARQSFNAFVEYAKKSYDKVESGVFQAYMKVELLNDGPITILLDSDKMF